MPDDTKFNARGAKLAMTDEQRKMIGTAIIDGLVTPGSFTFIDPLATEGGDYDQGTGPYTQSGGGNHNQEGGLQPVSHHLAVRPTRQHH